MSVPSLGITSTSFDPPVQSASISFAAMVDPTGSTDCAPSTWANGVRQITITPFSPGILATQDQTICNGAGPASVLFSTNPTTGSALQWYNRDGIIAPPANTDPIGIWNILTGQTGSFLTPGATSNSRTFACRVTNGANSQWATGVWQVTVLPAFNSGSLIGNQTLCAPYDPAPITMVTNPQGSGQYKWDWYYVENTTATCPTVASTTTGPSGWTTNSADIRFTGTSTTGVGISFDASSAGTNGRTWVLRIIPQASGYPCLRNCPVHQLPSNLQKHIMPRGRR